MDINESSFSRYKTTRSDISRSASDANAADASSRIKGTSDSAAQNSNVPVFKEGQLLKGEIIDHRYNDVQIRLEPWNQVVTAKLSGNVPLSIGQTASFQVTGNSADSLVLKYIPDDTMQTADGIIQKALMASNLSMTDKNKAIVQELLNNSMPIDKQTLQSLIKLSFTNREASPLTLVLMLKNNIPLTSENIRQFEAYQNGTHQLLNDIRTIASNLTKLITQADNPSAASIVTDPSAKALISESQLDALLSADTEAAGKDQPDAAVTDMAKGGLNITEEQLQAFATGQNTASAASSDSGVLTDSYDVINKLIQISGKLIEELTADENMTEPLADDMTTVANSQPQNSLPSDAPSSVQTNAVISDQLMNTNSSAVISDFLNKSERAALLNLMKSFPDSAGIKEQIENGTAPLEKVLSFIQQNLSGSGKEMAGRLLGSPEYTKLLENAFLQKWTISPEKLAKKTPVSELYENLQADMEELSHLIKAGGNMEEILQLREPVKNLQENLHFMKDLNDAFTYIQLPVRLKDKQFHSDLYVFTRKKALKAAQKCISVLLHLDMDSLGPLNVYLSLNNKAIQAKFYMADSEAKQLVTANMPSLSEALSKKGYQLSSEVVCNYKVPDFSRDFIEDNAAESDVKHYTFDIRT